MKPRFILLGILLLFSIFMHYSLKNYIVMTSRENSYLERELSSERAINKDLDSECNDLKAYSRIVTKASRELGMIFSNNAPDKVHIVHDTRVRTFRSPRNVFTLMDPVISTAEALTYR